MLADPSRPPPGHPSLPPSRLHRSHSLCLGLGTLFWVLIKSISRLTFSVTSPNSTEDEEGGRRRNGETREGKRGSANPVAPCPWPWGLGLDELTASGRGGKGCWVSSDSGWATMVGQ